MFKIYDGREHFYQWDLDRKLIVGDRTIQAVHFCNRTGACAITRDCYDVNGMWLVDVPNLCLQESYRLKVYGFSAAKYTTVSSQFDVKSRTKPDGYVYTDDEVNCWQDLDQRVAALEENPVSEEALDKAIEGYFAENPIDAGECIVEVVNGTGEDPIELDKTYDEIMEMIRAGKVVVIKHNGQLYYHSGGHSFRFVGPAETRAITLKDDSTTFYTETILPTFEDVEDTVNNAIANIEVGGGGIEIVNATGDETIELDKTYDEIMAMIEAGKNVVINYDGYLYHQFSDTPVFCYVGSMETRQISFNKRDYSVRYSENIVPAYEDVGTIVEEYLEGYAKTTDIPDVSAYQTAEQVNAAIANYVGVIENGTY